MPYRSSTGVSERRGISLDPEYTILNVGLLPIRESGLIACWPSNSERGRRKYYFLNDRGSRSRYLLLGGLDFARLIKEDRDESAAVDARRLACDKTCLVVGCRPRLIAMIRDLCQRAMVGHRRLSPKVRAAEDEYRAAKPQRHRRSDRRSCKLCGSEIHHRNSSTFCRSAV